MEKAELQSRWPHLKALMAESGPEAVLAAIAPSDPTDQIDLYAFTARSFYFEEWEGKTIDRYAAYTEAVIARCLEGAAAHPHLWERFTQAANAQSYNYSANLAECWPGEFPVRRADHFRAGLAAAERCIALRTTLQKDCIAHANAHWLAGAHLMALGEYGPAADRFATACRYALGEPDGELTLPPPADANLTAWMSAGHLAVAWWAQGNPAGEPLLAQVNQAVERIAQADPAKADDARFYQSQLRHVKGLYIDSAR